MFLLSLDEIDRVKRANGLSSLVDLERETGITRKTWRGAMNTREPKPAVLQALAALGARPNRILVCDEIATVTAA
ncbi:XRE family transcriptional regulator [Corynebacterium sp. c21Ua_68]|uniref:XRE family transcriptional regulator n=1 Tax=Corynebacterium yonathiae TaxID=2913504 RepID=A0A9X3RLS7_9CORY|nr:XRE family transcriptional regulator [Corynebacterium yonathiae]MCZ9296690.1 XRE family transcriptional regulator [Corynebacterium yonathiae]